MKPVLAMTNVAMMILVMAPVVLVVWMSFTPSAIFAALPVSDFSLRWYREVFSYDAFLDAALLSVRLAGASALVATVLGFLAAWSMVRFGLRGRGAAMGLFTSPLVVPAVVFGIAMLQFANRVGLYGSFLALLAAHVVIVTPFAIRTIEATLRGLGPELEWAAMSLGARPATALLRITVPLALRGLAAAFVLGFLMSFSEVTVTIFMTGPAHQTLPVRIFNYVSDRIDPTVAAVSALVIAATVALTALLALVGGVRALAK
jgi:putative spermidine/putrescine transport system permease protein